MAGGANRRHEEAHPLPPRLSAQFTSCLYGEVVSPSGGGQRLGPAGQSRCIFLPKSPPRAAGAGNVICGDLLRGTSSAAAGGSSCLVRLSHWRRFAGESDCRRAGRACAKVPLCEPRSKRSLYRSQSPLPAQAAPHRSRSQPQLAPHTMVRRPLLPAGSRRTAVAALLLAAAVATAAAADAAGSRVLPPGKQMQVHAARWCASAGLGLTGPGACAGAPSPDPPCCCPPPAGPPMKLAAPKSNALT